LIKHKINHIVYFIQFGVLRHLHMEGKEGNLFRYMTQTTREINNSWKPDFCKVWRKNEKLKNWSWSRWRNRLIPEP